VKILGSEEYVEMDDTKAEPNSIFVDVSDVAFKYVDSDGNVETFTNQDILNSTLTSGVRNLIRQLQDRAVTFTADGGEWAEAYTDADGRLDSVDTVLTDATFDTDKYTTTASATSVIYHDLPSGTFSATIDSAFGSGIVEDWETGDNIQYKFTNATEDTGWLEYNTISTFTAFTSQPTKCIVNLVIKSSPSAGFPSINGFGVIEC